MSEITLFKRHSPSNEDIKSETYILTPWHFNQLVTVVISMRKHKIFQCNTKIYQCSMCIFPIAEKVFNNV